MVSDRKRIRGGAEGEGKVKKKDSLRMVLDGEGGGIFDMVKEYIHTKYGEGLGNAILRELTVMNVLAIADALRDGKMPEVGKDVLSEAMARCKASKDGS